MFQGSLSRRLAWLCIISSMTKTRHDGSTHQSILATLLSHKCRSHSKRPFIFLFLFNIWITKSMPNLSILPSWAVLQSEMNVYYMALKLSLLLSISSNTLKTITLVLNNGIGHTAAVLNVHNGFPHSLHAFRCPTSKFKKSLTRTCLDKLWNSRLNFEPYKKIKTCEN